MSGSRLNASSIVASQPAGASTTSSSSSIRYGAVVRPKARAYAFWPMFSSLITTRMRGSVERAEVLARWHRARRCPRSRSRVWRRRCGGGRSRRISAAGRTRLCVRTTTAMPSSGARTSAAAGVDCSVVSIARIVGGARRAGDGRQTRITGRAPSRTASSALPVRSWSPGRRRDSVGFMGSAPSDRADLLLVCSSGGHLLQLVALRESWGRFTRAWVTFDKSDARSLLADERVFFAHGPTNRSIRNLLRNLLVAWRVVRETRPEGDADDRRRRRGAVRVGRQAARREGRLRREPRADRGPFAQLPADRADRRPPLRAVAGARRVAARIAVRRQRLRGGQHDLRQRRHERGAVRPAAAGGRRARDRRGDRRSSTATRRRRSRRAPSSSTSSRSRRWSRRFGAPASSSRTPASARSWSPWQTSKTPIVVPRRKAFGEAVDDHQLQLGRRFAQAGLVTLVEDPDGLGEALAREQATSRGRPGGEPARRGAPPASSSMRSHRSVPA